MRVTETSEFGYWFSSLELDLQAAVDARVQRIEEHDHFGTYRILKHGLFELKWTRGLRVYFTYVADVRGRAVLLLLGGENMGRIATSNGRGSSLRAGLRKMRPGMVFKRHDPTRTLRDPGIVKKAILSALAHSDYESVMDLYRGHLEVVNKSKAAATMGMSRQQVHRLIRGTTAPSLEKFVTFFALLDLERRNGIIAGSTRSVG